MLPAARPIMLGRYKDMLSGFESNFDRHFTELDIRHKEAVAPKALNQV